MKEFHKDLFYAIGSDNFWSQSRWYELIKKVELKALTAETIEERRLYRKMQEEIDRTAELDKELETIINITHTAVMWNIIKNMSKYIK
jgi:hypothetical protein